MNPFSTKTYKGPEYFIDREKETEKLLDAINSERNLTLFSHHRFGKTMLIQHVFSKLDNRKYQPIFVDLFATRNMVHFTQKLTEVLYDRKIILDNGFNKMLGSLGASMTFDPLSGNPEINFHLSNRESIIKSLPEMFKQMIKTKKAVVVAFDEFQELASYDEDITEALIRTIMQEFPQITFLFSGSRKSLMKEIFTNANRPFFQSTQMMELHEIDRDIYAREVFTMLEKNKKRFDEEVIYRILDETYCHTGFTQMMLSRIFSESEEKIDDFIYEQVWYDILEDYKAMAREQEFLLPSLQWKTLLAVAREEFVKAPQSREFSLKYNLSAPSSMARSIKALLDKGLIIECGDKGLRVYNVFIQKNLQKLYYS
ncbi:MAG: ATP-binding protein [Bacteroidales bacterium]|nr:ATP-binding protein [Bacteroidales bacterium]